ncbi:hypothetical protein KI387_000352 [Taxus chinensis]|uniref:DUF7054 domain-containing protein n=1 Tax=Taxus chinensis TaxID=29808 RepID=A0AA38GT06_TAXCH|nr:hypothetical protein KI387_000352 [Taxus chinensis]
MEKKCKSLDNGRPSVGVKGGGLHRHGHGHGCLPKPSCSNSGRFSLLHGEPLEKVPDPKSKKAIPLRRPKTHPELLNREKPAFERTPWLNLEVPPHLSKIAPAVDSAKSRSSGKLLVNVTVAQSIGPLRVLLPNDATVVDAIKAALAVYAKEGRRPILSSDPLSFGLHYSQFSIECLNPNDKMIDLGCRNFFLFPKKENLKRDVSCGTEMEQTWSVREPWYKLMDCFLALP